MTTQSFSTDNLQTLLSFPFRDADWKNKFLIGSLIVLAGFAIPLVPFFFVYGYMMQIMRHIIVDQGEPILPVWDDWSKLLLDGLKLIGVALIYMLPVIILMFIGFGIFFIVPLLGIPVIELAGEDTGGAIMGVLVMISMLVYFLLLGVSMLLALAIGVVMPAIMGHVVATDEFGAAFRFKEWWAIFRANVGGFLLAYVIIILLSIVVSFIYSFLYCTIIFCCLVPFVTAPMTMYLTVIYGAIFALAYRDGTQKLETQASSVEKE